MLIWAAAFLLWAWDAAAPARPGQAAVRIGLAGVTVRELRHPPGIGRRRFLPANPLQPFEAAILLDRGEADGRDMRDGLALFERFRRELRPAQWLSGALYLLVFAAIPAAVWRWSFAMILPWGLALTYALLIAACLWLFSVRGRYGLSRGEALNMCVQILLCPPYGANLARRLAARRRPALDPLVLARALDPDNARFLFADAVEVAQ
ncbi:MAG TPA: hypothetical protein VEZ20_10115 [Allosphingosinicella sp.]|nr:hypothetical protein [Allosphingosinicella sp.]